ncbi:MAG TPA: DNA translocase FtsK 4TM domain-containing protein, partial [Candidatus Gracilibacteria bacterium]|nr:DNA translocase FtsK 4TM domain-containing protein [Candidatus Gracilibacteria bacterium]
MARRRRNKNARRKNSARSRVALEINSSVVREIWAVIHLALGVFTFLSFNRSFGIVGEVWIGILNPVLGWGVQVVPYIFLFCSLMLFFSRRVSFPLAKLMGIFLIVVSVLSILHLYVPMDSIYAEAQAGRYGGYVGFVTNFLFRQVLSLEYIGAAAIFLTALLIGTLLTFEISLGALVRFLNPQIKIVRKPGRKKAGVGTEEDEA